MWNGAETDSTLPTKIKMFLIFFFQIVKRKYQKGNPMRTNQNEFFTNVIEAKINGRCRVCLETAIHHLLIKYHSIFYQVLNLFPTKCWTQLFFSVFMRPSFPVSFFFFKRQWLVANYVRPLLHTTHARARTPKLELRETSSIGQALLTLANCRRRNKILPPVLRKLKEMSRETSVPIKSQMGCRLRNVQTVYLFLCFSQLFFTITRQFVFRLSAESHTHTQIKGARELNG